MYCLFRSRLVAFFLFSMCLCSYAQDTIYSRYIIDTLTSEYFFGRGYTQDGLAKAGKFLKEEFITAGLLPMNGTYLQEVSYSVNTFPGEMHLSIDGNEMRPGKEFIITPSSRSLKGNFEVRQVDSNTFVNDRRNFKMRLADKLTWSISNKTHDSTGIVLLRSSITKVPSNVRIRMRNKWIKEFETHNVCGIVRGTRYPDSVILFTAHYDHLGGMGRSTYFPGANDNASGISQLLGLARYYAKNPQPYSIGFIAFTGEEAGLRGSEYYTNHPLLPLSSIRFVINLDLTGTGIDGITVVNATEFPEEFGILEIINGEYHFLSRINSRGKARNSDHYWFSERGVKAFFIYAMGGVQAYHDVYDISATLPNNRYVELFHLLRLFVERIQ